MDSCSLSKWLIHLQTSSRHIDIYIFTLIIIAYDTTSGQSNKEANLSKQVAELQGRVKSLEQLLHQGKDVLTLEEAAKFMALPAVHSTR